MNNNKENNKDTPVWNRTSWLWVFLCAALIFSTVPVARHVQRYVRDSIGSEFFTYGVLFIVLSLLTAFLYLFIFSFRVKSKSQYAWLLISSGFYIYTALQLRKYPEEAVHLLEFGLLSYFLFRALSHRIRDWTVYITTSLYVLLIGTMDEFIQWITPERVWDYKDVGINALAGVFFVLAVSKGIKPDIVRGPVKRISVNMLAGIMTVNLLFLGLCLSNTPDNVNRYTEIHRSLSWLRHEEPMTQFGFEHKDPGLGAFFSRMTLDQLKDIDKLNGETYGRMLQNQKNSLKKGDTLIGINTPNTNAFLHEFLIHVSRRHSEYGDFRKTGRIASKLIALKENQILQQYFGNTLKNTSYMWPAEMVEKLGNSSPSGNKDYPSTAGRLITLVSLRTAWALIIALLISVWIFGEFWKRRLED